MLKEKKIIFSSLVDENGIDVYIIIIEFIVVILLYDIYFVDFLVRLFHEKFKAYDFAFGALSLGSSTQ